MKNLLLLLLFSFLSQGEDFFCQSNLKIDELSNYVLNSPFLPKKLNILSLRDFQSQSGLPRFKKLNPRFSKSYRKIYGKKGSKTIERSLGSSVKEVLGRGWMSQVVLLENGRVFKLIIREQNKTSNIGILFETEAWLTYHLAVNYARYGLKVLPILSVGENGMYLEKPFVPRELIATSILQKNKSLTAEQMEALKDFHQKSMRLVTETGISLDLKHDNMFWYRGEWVILDPIGSIGFKGYSKTLDSPTFSEFYPRWVDPKSVENNGLKIDEVIKKYPEIEKAYKAL